ncbi:hypothetical protein [Actinoplanes sp. G11-F43]|uniref:hypothetical protein n=1 Tax=Actinoplanes sp. G11-F43 TaxID=3424130 RepID=UPI003D3571C1
MRMTIGAVAAAVVLAVGGLCWSRSGPEQSPPPDPAVAAALADRLTPLIEAAGAQSLPAGQREACGVRVLGTEPEVTTAAGATTVYAWAHCATLGAEVRGESIAPVRVILSPEVRVEVAGPWDYSDGRIATMFPERLHDAFLTGDRPAGLEAALQARLSVRR